MSGNPAKQQFSASTKATAKAAAVAAAFAVLVQAYPGKRERLDEVYAASLASISEGPELNSGIDLGERAAAQVIAWRQGDQANPGEPYRPETQPGMFVILTLPTIEPWFTSAKPWMLQSERQFLPGRPVDLKSATWLGREVAEYALSTFLTPVL